MVWCDNLRSICLAMNLVLHACIKHVKLDLQIACEMVLTNKLVVQHIASTHQPPNLFTMPLFIPSFQFCRSKLNIIYMSLCLREDIGYKHISKEE